MISVSSASIKERGKVPRKLAKMVTAAKREAWLEVGALFHEQMRPKRFTKLHAREAGYAKRKGENVARNSSRWKGSTAGQKFRKARSVAGAQAPLVFSGDTRTRTEIGNIKGTTKGVKVAYPGARKLNFKHPKSRVNMRREFSTLLPREVTRLADHFDTSLDKALAKLG